MKLYPLLLSFALALFFSPASAKPTEILNVSYDPTREFYQDFNIAFSEHWKKQSGNTVVVKQSHGGSGKQARAVIDGLQADVVTLALPIDIDLISKNGGTIVPDWRTKFPDDSSPYTSTIVLLVRKGNPKGIKDWDDLIKPGVGIVTPNPKTGGGARLNYLAAYGYALNTNGGDDAKAQAFIKALYGNVKVLDTGARGTTVTFVQNGIGDVEIAWENEAELVNKLSPGKFEIVYPSQSIRAEPPVAVVDANVDKHGTREVATAYLNFLYSPEGQDIFAQHYYRPRDPAVLAKYAAQFPDLKLFTVKELFGDWNAAQKKHFVDGGVFDQIYAKPGK